MVSAHESACAAQRADAYDDEIIILKAPSRKLIDQGKLIKNHTLINVNTILLQLLVPVIHIRVACM